MQRILDATERTSCKEEARCVEEEVVAYGTFDLILNQGLSMTTSRQEVGHTGFDQSAD